MTNDEAFLLKLSEATGLELVRDADGLCDLEAEGRLVTIRYEADDDAWSCSCLLKLAVPPGEATLRRAMAMNCFGRETLGFHLGLFGSNLILSGRFAMVTLDVEGFQERIILLVRTAAKLEAELSATSAPVEDSGDAPLNAADGMIRV